MEITQRINESWYSEWFNSPYYDMLYRHRNDEEAAAFIDKLLQKIQLESKAVLADIPCGNGRHARHLSLKGFEVYGFDLSKKNIDAAQCYLSERLHFALHDMRLPIGSNRFDAVFNLFTSLGYFRSDYADKRILTSFFAALKPQGLLVVDYFNTPYILNHLDKEKRFMCDGSEFYIQKFFDGKRIIKTIQITDAGKVYHYAERVRTYTKNDLLQLIQDTGFVLKEVFGDYNLNAFDEEQSPRCILIASKEST